MKKKLLTAILLLTLLIGMPYYTHAISTKVGTSNIQTSAQYEFQDRSQNLISKFFNWIFAVLSGKNENLTLKSDSIKEFSGTLKSYNELEQAQNPEYEDSKTKDKLDFSTGILDIIAGILSFFGL